MTFEEKMAAIDQYFDNITSEEFNDMLEKKYGIPKEDCILVNESIRSNGDISMCSRNLGGENG